MQRRILIFLAACFYYSGLVGLLRWRTRRTGAHLLVLQYRCADSERLKGQLLYLRRHYHLMQVEAALEELYAPKDVSVSAKDRRTPLAVTFDDGYRDNYTHAFALAQQLQIPFSVYLIPAYIERGDFFWWFEGKRLVERAQVQEVTFDEHTYHLTQPEECRVLSNFIDERLRCAASIREREAFLVLARKALSVPSTVQEEDLPYFPLLWEQVHEMNKSSLVSFGAHSMHHPILSCLSEPAELNYEVAECRSVLASQLGYPVRTFAYPLEREQAVSEDELQAVKRAGYNWAFTTNYGMNTPESDPFQLYRVRVDAEQHWLVFAAEVAGLWRLLAEVRWLSFMRDYFMQV